MSLFLVIIYMILTFLRPQDFVAPLMGMPLVLYVLMGLLLVLILKLMNKEKISIINTQQDKLMFVFWAAIVISTLSVHWMQYTYDIFFLWMRYVMIYIVLTNLIKTEQHVKVVLWTIVLSMGLTSWFGIQQFYGSDILGIGPHSDGRIRGVGIFDTNQLAYTIDFCLALLLGISRGTKNFFAKTILLVITCIYVYAVYLTQSRGGLLCLIAVVFFYLIVFSKSKFVKTFAPGVGYLGFITIMQLSQRFSSTLSYNTDESAQIRIEIWGGALSLLREHPLFGIGFLQFREYFKHTAHSAFIECSTELGLFGLFCWLALFYFTFKNIGIIEESETLIDRPVLMSYIKSLKVAFFAYLIGCFFSGNTYYITLFILFSLVVVIQKILSDKIKFDAKIFWKDLKNIALLETGIILMLHTFLKFN